MTGLRDGTARLRGLGLVIVALSVMAVQAVCAQTPNLIAYSIWTQYWGAHVALYTVPPGGGTATFVSNDV